MPLQPPSRSPSTQIMGNDAPAPNEKENGIPATGSREEDPSRMMSEQRIRVVSRSSSNRPINETYIRTDQTTSWFQLPGAGDTAASFEFVAEDHTLGNALRWIIMKKYFWSFSFFTRTCYDSFYPSSQSLPTTATKLNVEI